MEEGREIVHEELGEGRSRHIKKKQGKTWKERETTATEQWKSLVSAFKGVARGVLGCP